MFIEAKAALFLLNAVNMESELASPTAQRHANYSSSTNCLTNEIKLAVTVDVCVALGFIADQGAHPCLQLPTNIS